LVKKNGEAIYNTKPWDVRSENTTVSPIYYTSKNSTIYAIFIRWPDSSQITLTVPIGTKDTRVTLLGYGERNYVYKSDVGLTISLPPLNTGHPLSLEVAWVLKITNLAKLPSLVNVESFWNPDWTDFAPCTPSLCGVVKNTSLKYEPSRYEGLLFKTIPQNGERLLLYYSNDNHDFAAINERSELPNSYKYIEDLGFVSMVKNTGLVPLNLYWSNSRKDYFLVGVDGSYDEVDKNDYKFSETVGYVYPGPFYYKVFIK